MKFVDEYRDSAASRKLAAAVARRTTQPWTIMEICGGQTHSILKFGIDQLLPPAITLVHGPGCPVCVTSAALIDAAIALASRPDVTLCSFGDMLRVPGSSVDLQSTRARGGRVRIVYSPFDAVAFAAAHPEHEVVFFAVGFETTAPANALAVLQAHALGLSNFALLVSHVLVPPAIEAILAAPDNHVQGFLAAGHVCTVMGTAEYLPLADRFHVPIVVTGFEPIDILAGVLECVTQLENGGARVSNAYGRAVKTNGNIRAQEAMRTVFQTVDREWRGLGVIRHGGLELSEPFHRFDALRKFDVTLRGEDRSSRCRAGNVLRGQIKPSACAAFGTDCTPEHPLGAPMVSAEGACAAYFRYRRHAESNTPA